MNQEVYVGELNEQNDAISWFIKPVRTRIFRSHFTSSDLTCAYHQILQKTGPEVNNFYCK